MRVAATALRAAAAAARRQPARARSTVLKITNLPFGLNTEALLRQALADDAAVAPRAVALKTRASTERFNGSATLAFDDVASAEKAMRTFRKDGTQIGGRDVRCAWGAEPFRADAPSNTEEDPLAEVLRELDERRLPTLDIIREELMQADQHGILRQKRLPGLTWPEDLTLEEVEPEKPKAKPKDPSEPLGRWAETIVKVDRVQKVVRGGTIMRYRALVVVGNLMGAGGFAFGKGHSPQDAVRRATHAAKRDLRFVDRYRDVALLHDVSGKHNGCLVDIYATKPGAGAVGGPLGRQILTQLGFSAFTIKARGRRTPYSYVRATFEALAKHSSVEEIARRRGRRLLEVEHAVRSGKGLR